MNWHFPQISRGSFSAVSTPIFASKNALGSSRRDLLKALLCTVLDRSLSSKVLLKIREVSGIAGSQNGGQPLKNPQFPN